MHKATYLNGLTPLKSALLTVVFSLAMPTFGMAETVSLTGDGLIHTRSAYSVEETAKRIKADVEKKGILFPTAKADSGMDWPVRVLIKKEKDGKVWAVYQDWKWVAKRYGITNRDEQFAKATEVVMSIMSSIADCKKVADCSE